ncbi:glycoside hydrolase [Lentinus tigrinus ALCF2SS1-7]|uniref:Glycoside hydrolase n=1 Tax=Lentinus tigrinus ALCF2SS1-6 TaxID=1328759 RepID=A0A5C2S935_9APHY|nr:glycoside hydrolase [Lentinus tigrinus ALCF2SS1-6]RPD70867.1 glycoside hydrolase [Lentinus tigrinus ALCF2SS1-7]
MRKLLHKLKDHYEDHVEPHGHAAMTAPRDQSKSFPDEQDMYRYRKQRGVNLGSWFVLERWITDAPFRAARAPALSDLDVATGSDAKSILERHWDTWVTNEDWAWLAGRGINTVRIPIGYYHLCGADPSVLRGTDFADLGQIFAGAWSRVTHALATASQHGIGVLFDLHAAPGKQNGDSHSGTSNEPTFFKQQKNMSHTIHCLAALVTHITEFARSREPPLPNLVGIELLNEPQPGPHNDALKKWYMDAFRAIRAIDPDLPLYVSDSWMTDQYAGFIKASGIPFVVLDHHLYRCFTSGDISTPAAEHARRLRDPHDHTSSMFSRVAKDLESAGGALVVGEWSAALNPGSLHGASDERAEKHAYVQAQLQLYEEHCAGWFFWTYKKEGGIDTGWSFRDAVDAGVFPGHFRRTIQRSPTDSGAEMERARATASAQHASYWNQYPGPYEHWRFDEGFATGWEDAARFAAWHPGQFADELGFKGPWAKRRAGEHISAKGDGNVWEYEHGFSQGCKAAYDYMYSSSET